MNPSGDSLEQRYGAPSRGRRAGVLVFAGIIVASFLGWLLWAMLFHIDPDVSSAEIGHEVLDDHTATIKVRIEYGDEPVDAKCSLRAISHDKAIVGELEFEPDPTQGPVYEIEVSTERRATTVEWIGCTAPDQPRPR